MTQISRTITLTTGTPVRLATIKTLANSLFIQMQPGSAAIGYVLYADLDFPLNIATAGQVVATLGPGSAVQPGSSFSFPTNGAGTTQAGGMDVSLWGVAGSTGDTVIVSWDQRQ